MKKKRLLIALLSLTCASTLADGLSACGGDKHDSAIYSLYQTYAQNAGENALTYEKWLESILVNGGNDGQPGANGKSAYEIAVENGFTGTQAQWLASLVGENGLSAYEQYCEANPEYEGDEAQWLASLVGTKGTNGKSAYEIYVEETKKENPDALVMDEAQWLASLAGGQGVGIADISLSTDGTTLTVTYTDSSKRPTVINLPGAFHVHTYGEVVTVIAPTSESDGIGYRTCIRDGHAEVVVLPQLGYNVTVYAEDGSTPLEGVTVTINGAHGETDENGKIKVTGFGEFGKYPVNLSGYGDDYHYFAVYTSVESTSFNITLAKILNEGDNIDHEGKYAAEFNDWEGNGTWELNEVKHITVGKEGEDAKYNFSFTTGNILINSRYYYYNSPDCFVIANSEFKEVELMMTGSDTGSARPDPLYMQVNVTTGSVPARGTADNPIAVKPGKNTATAIDGKYYFTFKHVALTENNNPGDLIFTFGEDTTLAVVMGDTEHNVVSGEVIPNLNKYANYSLIARPSAANTSGEVNFTAGIEYGAGKWLATAYEINELSDNTIERAVDGVAYFKYTPATDETAVLALTGGLHITVYENPSFTEQLSNEFASVNNGGRVILNLTGGKDYYFEYNATSQESQSSFVLRAMNESDAGLNPATAIPLESGTPANAIKGSVAFELYYKVVLSEYSTVTFVINNNTSAYLSQRIDFYADKDCKQSLGGKRGNSYSVPAEAGTVYIKLSVTYAGGEYDLVPTVTVTKIENVDYKVTLTDTTGGKPAGITVNLGTYDQSGAFTQISTGTSDENGVVTFADVKPLTGYDIVPVLTDTNYVFSSDLTTVFGRNEYTIRLGVYFDYTVTVYAPVPEDNESEEVTHGDALANVKVTIEGKEYTTDENGQFTVKLLHGRTYGYTLAGYDKALYAAPETRSFSAAGTAEARTAEIVFAHAVKANNELLGEHKLTLEGGAVALTVTEKNIYAVTGFSGNLDFSVNGTGREEFEGLVSNRYYNGFVIELNANDVLKVWGVERGDNTLQDLTTFTVSQYKQNTGNLLGNHDIGVYKQTADVLTVAEDGVYIVTTQLIVGFAGFSVNEQDMAEYDKELYEVSPDWSTITITLKAGDKFSVWAKGNEGDLPPIARYTVTAAPKEVALETDTNYTLAKSLGDSDIYVVGEAGNYYFVDNQYDGLTIVVNGIVKQLKNMGETLALNAGDKVQVYATSGEYAWATTFKVTKK